MSQTTTVRGDDPAALASLYDELVALGRSTPDHQVTAPASVFADIADHYHQAGYVRGKAEPVRATIKDIGRDDGGGVARIVEYDGVAPRP